MADIILLWKKATFHSFWWKRSGKSSKLLSRRYAISYRDRRHSGLVSFWYCFTKIVCNSKREAGSLDMAWLAELVKLL